MRLTSSLHSPRHKVERLIAGGRVVLTVATLLAIRLDPSQTEQLADRSRLCLLLYLLYSLVLMLLTWEARVGSPRLALSTQLLDLAGFTSLMAFTGGSGSPLFVLFLFSIFSGALRWQQQGTLLTTLAVLGLYAGLALMEQPLGNGRVELDSLIIRCVYLAVAALALGYLTAYERRTRIELSRLVAWSERQEEIGDLHGRIKGTLQQALAVLDMSQAVLIWNDPEEPFRMVAHLVGKAFSCGPTSTETYEPLVTPVLADTDFLYIDTGTGKTAIVHTLAGSHRWHGTPWHADLQERYSLGNSLCLRLQADYIEGRLLLSGKADLSVDDLYLGELVGQQVAAVLGRFYAQQRVQQLAQARERVRLARDLHDGLLQSLTGLALQLEFLRRQPDVEAEALRQRIAEVQGLIADEQRALRTLIRQLKPGGGSRSLQPGLAAELNQLASRIERQWGIQVQLRVEPEVAALPEAMAGEIRFLLLEALANSGKHARASRVHAHLTRQEDRLYLGVRDDGQGFSFIGRHDLTSLMAMRLGPQSLMERTLALGGQLVIESSRGGSLLEILLPWSSQDGRGTTDPLPGRIAS